MLSCVLFTLLLDINIISIIIIIIIIIQYSMLCWDYHCLYKTCLNTSKLLLIFWTLTSPCLLFHLLFQYDFIIISIMKKLGLCFTFIVNYTQKKISNIRDPEVISEVNIWNLQVKNLTFLSFKWCLISTAKWFLLSLIVI